jgi:hypothetical protein
MVKSVSNPKIRDACNICDSHTCYVRRELYVEGTHGGMSVSTVLCMHWFRRSYVIGITFRLRHWTNRVHRSHCGVSGVQLVQKFPAFDEMRRFITVLTATWHRSLSWVTWMQSTSQQRPCVSFVIRHPSWAYSTLSTVCGWLFTYLLIHLPIHLPIFLSVSPSII